MFKKILKRLVLFGIASGTIGIATGIAFYSYFASDLPNVKSLENVTFNQPLQIYDSNGVLLSDYGKELRHPIPVKQFPKYLTDAVVAIEDRRFWENKGVDPIGIARAAFILITTGHKSQGASTITQQVARNFFLTNKKEYIRKIREIILAIHMNNVLSKDDILGLYMNKIYLGHRSYGFVAAARTYFNKNVQNLTLSEAALLAGIQQAPSLINPITNLQASIKRRNQVLLAMLNNNYITKKQYEEALNSQVIVNPGNTENKTGYISELIRQALYHKYGESIYSSGLKVYTTINSKIQQTAILALRNNLLAYTRRHGWRGVKIHFFSGTNPYTNAQLQAKLKKIPRYDPIYPVVILSATPQVADALDASGNHITLNLQSIAWAGKYIDVNTKGTAPTAVNAILQPGDVVYVSSRFGDDFQIISTLQQIPVVNSGLVSIDVNTGAIQALVGGFSYNRSLYNRATQAEVQVGSTVKPFIYADALENGLTLGTIIDDVPIAIKLPNGDIWRPQNYANNYAGPITIRQALAQSRNVVAVKVARELGLKNVAQYLQRFGFAKNEINITNSLALGAVNFTPLEMARAYAVFDNGGFLINPYLINKIEDADGNIIYQAHPLVACSANTPECNSIPSIYSTKEQNLSNSDLTSFNINNSNKVTNSNTPTVNNSNNTNNLIKPEDKSDALGLTAISSKLSNNIDVNSISVDQLNAEVDKKGIGNDQIGVKTSSQSDIDRIFDLANNNIDQINSISNKYAPRVLSPTIAWLMHNALETDIWGGPGYTGTGRRLQALGRHDIGGKTGTTNQSRTTWFVGFAGPYATAVYTAFDNNTTLGKYEQGALTALPAWYEFEKVQLQGIPLHQIPIPNDLVMTKINPHTGLLDPNGYTEYFINGTQPTQVQTNDNIGTDSSEYRFVPTLPADQVGVEGNTYTPPSTDNQDNSNNQNPNSTNTSSNPADSIKVLLHNIINSNSNLGTIPDGTAGDQHNETPIIPPAIPNNLTTNNLGSPKTPNQGVTTNQQNTTNTNGSSTSSNTSNLPGTTTKPKVAPTPTTQPNATPTQPVVTTNNNSNEQPIVSPTTQSNQPNNTPSPSIQPTVQPPTTPTTPSSPPSSPPAPQPEPLTIPLPTVPNVSPNAPPVNQTNKNDIF